MLLKYDKRSVGYLDNSWLVINVGYRLFIFERYILCRKRVINNIKFIKIIIIIIIDINYSYNILFFVNNLYCMYGMNCRYY